MSSSKGRSMDWPDGYSSRLDGVDRVEICWFDWSKRDRISDGSVDPRSHWIRLSPLPYVTGSPHWWPDRLTPRRATVHFLHGPHRWNSHVYRRWTTRRSYWQSTLSHSYLDRRYSKGAGPSQAAAKWIGRRSYLSKMLYSGMTESSCFKYFGFGLIAAQWIGVIYNCLEYLHRTNKQTIITDLKVLFRFLHHTDCMLDSLVLRRQREEPRRDERTNQCLSIISLVHTWWWRALKPWNELVLISSIILAASLRWPARILWEIFS